MKNRFTNKKVLSAFIMPFSLLFALAVMYVIYKITDVNYYEIVYDYKQFYVFSAPVILFFAGGISIPKIWDKDNKKLSKKVLTVSFALNVIIIFGITVFEELRYDLYLFNPYNHMSVEGFTYIFESEYVLLFPIVWIINILFSALCLIGVPLLGAYLFSLNKKIIKVPVLCLLAASLIAVGLFGINAYKSDNIFYDVKGNEYSDPYDVVYYDERGNKYKIEEVPDYHFDFEYCNIKVKSVDGSKEYYLGECYINEETGLMIADPSCKIIIPLTRKEFKKMEEKSFDDESYFQIYKDRKGNKYRQIGNALYDKSGKLLDKYRFRINSTYYQLLKDANADGNYYHYDLKGNRYVRGETIKFFDARGNTYIKQPCSIYDDNSNYDIYDKNGIKIGTVDGWDCLIDINTGLLIKADYEYNYDSGCFEDNNGNKYQNLSSITYDKNGKVESSYTVREGYYNW